MSVQDDEIQTIFDEICIALMGTPAVLDAPADPPENTQYLTGCVSISGNWEGAVTVGCTADFARALAGAMFDMPVDEVAGDEMHDAIGEVTNMAGGNIKSLLPGPSQLSLPTVTDGKSMVVTVPGGVRMNRVGLDCGGHRVTVTIYRSSHVSS